MRLKVLVAAVHVGLGCILNTSAALSQAPTSNTILQLQILNRNFENLRVAMEAQIGNLRQILNNSTTEAERQNVLTMIGEIELQLEFFNQEKGNFETNLRQLGSPQ